MVKIKDITKCNNCPYNNKKTNGCMLDKEHCIYEGNKNNDRQGKE